MGNQQSQGLKMAERSEPLKFSDEELARYKKNFTLFDKQATGAIPADELATVLRACGQNPTEAEIAILVEKVDINKNGLIEFEEFCELMSKTNKDPNEMEDLILKAFQTFDQDNSGTIDKDELLSTLTTMGDKVDEKMVMSMIEEADVDGDGKINYQEFSKIMLKDCASSCSRNRNRATCR